MRASRRLGGPAHRRRVSDGRRASRRRLAAQHRAAADRPDGPLLSLRRFAPRAFTLEALVERGSLDADDRRSCSHASVAARLDIVDRGRDVHGQDLAARGARGARGRDRADRHRRGLGRAPHRSAARRASRGATREPRGQRRHHDPRARPQRVADAARPADRRRGARRRGARPAAGHEHRSRRVADDRAREHAGRCAAATRDARAARQVSSCRTASCASRSRPRSTSSCRCAARATGVVTSRRCTASWSSTAAGSSSASDAVRARLAAGAPP